MNAHRQIDLNGSINACDEAGRSLQISCEGAVLAINAVSMRAAISAFSTLRASGAANRLDPRVLERLNDFRIELRVGGQQVGRAGSGARASRLARVVTNVPVELHFMGLLKAAFTAF